MKNRKFASLVSAALIVAAVGISAPAFARDDQPGAKAGAGAATLKVGDKAPAISIDTWVKGKPVTGFEKGKVYVVEFWATWCGPCKKSIPHLTELQKQHKDAVTLIGISGVDRNGETLDKVKDFVEKTGDKMGYTVAFDKGRETRAAYMEAAQQPGIPTAFVVSQETKVVWIGNPLYPQGEIDAVLESVKAGKSGEADLKAVHEKVMEKQKAIDSIAERGMKAMQASDHDTALKAWDELLKVDASNADQYNMFKMMTLLTGKKDYEAGYAFAKSLAEGVYKDDSMNLNSIAWTILDQDGIEKRDFDLALKMAERANTLTGGKSAEILDTLARAHFEKGNLAKAVEIEKKAVELADGQMKGQLEEELTKYEKALKDKK